LLEPFGPGFDVTAEPVLYLGSLPIVVARSSTVDQRRT